MEENQKKAFDFSADLTKQLITLSTGIFTLTVTFSKDIIGSIDNSNKYLLLTSWIIFIISILFGILTLMALTGNLDPISKQKNKKDKTSDETEKNSPILTITSSNITSTAKLQVYSFLLALCLTCWYGYSAISGSKNELVCKEKSQVSNCDCKDKTCGISIENNPVFNNDYHIERTGNTKPAVRSNVKWCRCDEKDTIIVKKK